MRGKNPHPCDRSIAWRGCHGNGTFQAKQSFGTGVGHRSVAVADLDGDGKVDLVTPDYSDNTASVLLGNGNGTFRAKQSLATGTYPDSVVVADLNGDEKMDLVSADDLSDTVSVLLGNGNGTFRAKQSFGTGTGSQPWLRWPTLTAMARVIW